MEEIRQELNRRTCYDANRILLWCSFSLFIFFLLFITLLKACIYGALWASRRMVTFNLYERFMYQFERPFPTNKNEIRDLLLNIEMFLPMGIYLPLLMKKRCFLKGLIITLGIISFIELVQLFDALGGMHYLDFICNTLGYVLGYCIFMLIIERWCTKKVINGINIGIIAIASPCMIYSVITTLMHLEWYYMFYNGTLVAP